MPRSEARVRCRIWQDDDFTSLSLGAQYAYLLILSQGDISLVGVVAYVPHRWARLANDLSQEALREYMAELAAARFVVVDDVTDEVWVRSFIKWDGVLKSRKTRQAMWTAFLAVHSRDLRRRILGAVPEEVLKEALDEEWIREPDLPPPDTPSHTPWDTPSHGVSHTPSAAPGDTRSHTPPDRAFHQKLSTGGNTDSFAFSDSPSFPRGPGEFPQPEVADLETKREQFLKQLAARAKAEGAP